MGCAGAQQLKRDAGRCSPVTERRGLINTFRPPRFLTETEWGVSLITRLEPQEPQTSPRRLVIATPPNYSNFRRNVSGSRYIALHPTPHIDLGLARQVPPSFSLNSAALRSSDHVARAPCKAGCA